MVTAIVAAAILICQAFQARDLSRVTAGPEATVASPLPQPEHILRTRESRRKSAFR